MRSIEMSLSRQRKVLQSILFIFIIELKKNNKNNNNEWELVEKFFFFFYQLEGVLFPVNALILFRLCI